MTDEQAQRDAKQYTLRELTSEFMFFTPALVVLKGGLNRDLVAEAVASTQLSAEQQPAVVDCQWPLFAQLRPSVIQDHVSGEASDIHWGHRLYMVPKDVWGGIEEFMRSVAVLSADRSMFGRAFSHLLQMVDPTTTQSSKSKVVGELPYMPVTIIGFASHRATHYMAEASRPAISLPFPAEGMPRPDIVEEAKFRLKEPT